MNPIETLLEELEPNSAAVQAVDSSEIVIYVNDKATTFKREDCEKLFVDVATVDRLWKALGNPQPEIVQVELYSVELDPAVYDKLGELSNDSVDSY